MRRFAPIIFKSAPGDGTTEATLALATVLIGSIATLAPAILSLHASNWGVCVMIAGIARGAFMLVAAFAMLKANPDAAAQAVSRGAVGGAVLILICEAAAAIRILSRLDRTIQPTRAAATGSQA